MNAIRESELNVTGATRYLDDLPEARGSLFATPTVSPCARGRLLGIDASAALALDPSVRVFTAADIPGENQLGEDVADSPLLVADEWEYQGQCLALVLGADRSLARRAAELVKIRYEELSPILDAREVAEIASREARGGHDPLPPSAADLADSDPRRKRFVIPPRSMKMGDPESAFGRCAVVVKGRVDSGGQEHVYLETQGAIAEPREGSRLYVLSGTQSPTGVQHAVARVLGREMNDIEVETRRMGGAFGGKEEQGAQWAALAALGAALTGKTVKVYLGRREDMRWTGKRHPYSSDFKIGLDAEGRVLAFEADYYQNSGACCDLSPAILSRTLFHATNAYRVPNVRVTGYSCRTNLPPFTAFRGFGAPQGVFVMECAMDAAAEQGGWDPVELRTRNLLAEGDSFHYGQSAELCRAGRTVERALETSRWKELRKEIDSFNASHRLEKRGATILPIAFGISFTKFIMNQGGALVHVYRDGSVSVATGATEMGQQVSRKIQVVVARSLGVDESRVKVEATRTSTVANTYPTAASTGSDINGMAALAACEEIRGRLLKVAAGMLGTDAVELRIENGAVVRGCEPTELGWDKLVDQAHLNRVDLSAHGFYATPGLSYNMKAERGSPFAYHVYGCAAVSATVDVLRGSYRLDRAFIVHDGGESLDQAVDRGQVEGAFAQGLGWSLLEDLRYDGKGSLASDTLSTYKLPDVHFMPSMEIEFLKDAPNPKAVMRSKAIGEPPLLYGMAGYFAVLDALRAARRAAGEDAKGLYDLPLTPEKVLDYLQGVRP
ncbi:MAG: molybdopterin-dependent oxidoreductase [Treponema sp.]|nr:molybdopterin-dependent oxidoreductase [Treponema sp.]